MPNAPRQDHHFDSVDQHGDNERRRSQHADPCHSESSSKRDKMPGTKVPGSERSPSGRKLRPHTDNSLSTRGTKFDDSSPVGRTDVAGDFSPWRRPPRDE